MRSKRGIFSEYLGWLLIALLVLVVGLAAYFIISGKYVGLIEYVKNLFRFRR